MIIDIDVIFNQYCKSFLPLNNHEHVSYIFVVNMFTRICVDKALRILLINPLEWIVQIKGSRRGRSDKASLWCVTLLINTRFRLFILK